MQVSLRLRSYELAGFENGVVYLCRVPDIHYSGYDHEGRPEQLTTIDDA